MKFQAGLLLSGAAQSLAAVFPATTYGDNYHPLVNSKPYQDLVTTEG